MRTRCFLFFTPEWTDLELSPGQVARKLNGYSSLQDRANQVMAWIADRFRRISSWASS